MSNAVPMSPYNCGLMFRRMVRDSLVAFRQHFGEERYREGRRQLAVRDAYRDVLAGITANPTAAQCPGFREWVRDNRATCERIIEEAIR